MNRWVTTFLLLILISGCQTNKKALEKLNQPLKSTTWYITSIAGTDIDSTYQSRPHIIFDSTGRYYGNLGCNRFFGHYMATKKKISMEYAGSTKMLCPDMDIEKKVGNALKKEINYYKILRDTLFLYEKATEVMKLSASPDRISE